MSAAPDFPGLAPLEIPRMFFADPASTPNQRTKDPSVVAFQGAFLIYYTVWLEPKRTGIGIARSRNLLDWTPVALLPLQGDLEADGVAAPGAVVLEGRVHLFYQTYSQRDFHGAAILHAVSEDGIHFRRNPTNPVHRPRDAGGVAFPWCSGRAIDAEVFPLRDRLRLFYATRDPSGRRQMLGAASAPLDSTFDRAAWTPLSVDGPLLEPRVPTPLDPHDLDLTWEGDCIEAATLLEHRGHLYLFYAGNYNKAPQQVGVAVSDDGLHFRRLNAGQPILRRGEPGTWNHTESGHPGVLRAPDGRDYLFFQGCNDHLPDPLDWHLSVVALRWLPQPDGIDLPMPDTEALRTTVDIGRFSSAAFFSRHAHTHQRVAEPRQSGRDDSEPYVECPTPGPVSTDPEVSYRVRITEPGRYRLSALVQAEPQARLAARTASEPRFFETPLTPTDAPLWVDLRTAAVPGPLRIEAPGPVQIALRLSHGLRLWALELTPMT